MTTPTARIVMCKRCRRIHMATDRLVLACVLSPGNWGSWKPELRWSGGKAELSPRVAEVMLLMMVRGHAPVSTPDLIEWLYGACPDGGPDTAEISVKVHLCRLRQLLRRAEFPGEFHTHYGRGVELVMPPRPAEQREIAA